jgi:4a-hydroxytetrahydrobiopterin dehydratase
MRLTPHEISQHRVNCPGWDLLGDQLVREWTWPNFAAALTFVNQVGALAEAADHHPDISLYGWNHVRLQLTTHSAGGLTTKDFTLAAAINDLCHPARP